MTDKENFGSGAPENESHSDVALVYSERGEFRDGRVIRWIRHYKDVIEAVAIVVGIVTALISLWFVQRQLGQLADSDKAMSYQTTLLTEQVQAIWYGNRPVLRFSAHDPSRDIEAYEPPLLIRTGGAPDTVYDVRNLYTFSYTLESVGSSTAILDTIFSRVSFRDVVQVDSLAMVDLEMPPQTGQVIEVRPPVSSRDTNWVSLRVVYRWRRGPSSEDRFELSKCVQIRHDPKGWHIYWIPCSESR